MRRGSLPALVRYLAQTAGLRTVPRGISSVEGSSSLVQYCLLDGTRVQDEARTLDEIKALGQRLNAQNPGSVVLIERPSGRLGMAERLSPLPTLGCASRYGNKGRPHVVPVGIRPRGALKGRPGVILASEFSATSTFMSGAVNVNPVRRSQCGGSVGYGFKHGCG